MSEYMFGVSNRRLEDAEVEYRDRVCREEGGYGYVQAKLPGEGWRGWFTAPNLGSPFDERLSDRVMRRINGDDGE